MAKMQLSWRLTKAMEAKWGFKMVKVDTGGMIQRELGLLLKKFVTHSYINQILLSKEAFQKPRHSPDRRSLWQRRNRFSGTTRICTKGVIAVTKAARCGR
ncbi:hypothetical protein L1887_35247 [Cichorium endivia]|nr:hypothetical protein L1887_35247 [Cichorium endivia]